MAACTSSIQVFLGGPLFFLSNPKLILAIAEVAGPNGRAVARLLILWVRIPPGAWMFVCCECCVLSGRGLCDELITSTEESYRL